MNARRFQLVLLAILCFSFARTASAHRLDEYLQATRISLETNRISVEMDLTPGAEVAKNVFAMIDENGDEEISSAEGSAYLTSFVKALSLRVDGQTHPLKLEHYRMPSLAETRRGEGIIRLQAGATIGTASTGRHQLTFANAHRSDIGVYLVNALIPSDERIRITGQSRDLLQREFSMDYSVAAGEKTAGLADGLAPALAPLLGLALALAFFAAVKRFA
jgi:hypothetical protein